MADPYADIADLIRGGLPPKKRSAVDEIAGGMANFNRGTGIGDEIAGVGNAGARLFTPGAVDLGKLPMAAGAELIGRLGGHPGAGKTYFEQSGVPQALRGGMADQRAVEDQFSAEHPVIASGMRGTGSAATVFLPAGKAAGVTLQGGRALNMGRGAVAAGAQAGTYGLADRGTIPERMRAAGSDAVNPVVLALGVGGGYMAGGKAPPMKAQTPQKTLQDAGVFLTPGVKAGGLAKNVEDLSMRAPILGPAITGARQRSNASLNRAVGNRALEPIGQTVPANIKPGHETVDYVATQLGKEYDKAASMVPALNADDTFVKAMAAIKSTASELPPDVQAQFNTIIQNRLVSRFDGRPLDGNAIREIQSEIGNISSKYGSSQDGAQQMLAEHLDEVSQALGDLIGRHSPEAQAIIGKANAGYRNYVVLRTAAAKSNKDGVFTPGQLSTAVRTSDKSVGKGNVAKGKAAMQDLSGAASEVMPDQFGNPGTANAIGLAGLVGYGLKDPLGATGAVAGLTAAATPYFLMGRKVVDSLPANAGRAELESAAAELKRLAASDPKVAQLQQEIALRLSRGGGLLGAQTLQGASSQ